MSTSINPAIITSVAAFAGATAAQVLSHVLTTRREKKKWYSEVHYKFISPILSKVFLYYDFKTTNNKDEFFVVGVDESELFGEILEHIKKNLMYADEIVTTSFYNWERASYYIEEGGHRESLEVDLLIRFLTYSLDVNKISRIFQRSLVDAIHSYRVQFLTFYTLRTIGMKHSIIEWALAHFFSGKEIKRNVSDDLFKYLVKVHQKSQSRTDNSGYSNWISKRICERFRRKKTYGKNENFVFIRSALYKVGTITKTDSGALKYYLNNSEQFEETYSQHVFSNE